MKSSIGRGSLVQKLQHKIDQTSSWDKALSTARTSNSVVMASELISSLKQNFPGAHVVQQPTKGEMQLIMRFKGKDYQIYPNPVNSKGGTTIRQKKSDEQVRYRRIKKDVEGLNFEGLRMYIAQLSRVHEAWLAAGIFFRKGRMNGRITHSPTKKEPVLVVDYGGNLYHLYPATIG